MKATTELVEKSPLRRYVDGRGTKLVWLADQMDVSTTHLHFLLDGERRLLPKHADRLVEIYGEDIRAALPEDTNGSEG